MTLGLRVEQLRFERELSLSELARRAGISSGHLSNLERDTHRHVSVYTLRRVARALGVTLDEVMKGVDDV